MAWRDALSSETRELLRIFEAMNRGVGAYGARWSKLVGDNGEGYGKPITEKYADTFMEATIQLEEVAMEVGGILGVVPAVWSDPETDYMDSDTWSGAVSDYVNERDEVEKAIALWPGESS